MPHTPGVTNAMLALHFPLSASRMQTADGRLSESLAKHQRVALWNPDGSSAKIALMHGLKSKAKTSMFVRVAKESFS
jgi:hypothetical protein